MVNMLRLNLCTCEPWLWEKALGPDHADVALVCHSLAELYRKIDKKEEAEKLEERASKISSLS